MSMEEALKAAQNAGDQIKKTADFVGDVVRDHIPEPLKNTANFVLDVNINVVAPLIQLSPADMYKDGAISSGYKNVMNAVKTQVNKR